MVDAERYLAGIGYPDPVDHTPRALRELHRRHMERVPYDNSAWVERGESGLIAADIDLDAVFGAGVLGGRGGNCLELSGSFHRLLDGLGFEPEIYSAALWEPDGRFADAEAHLLLGVRLRGELWLVDVGFAGPGFIEPLRVTDGVQEQHGCGYRVTENGGRLTIERRPRDGAWRALYRLTPRPRAFGDWHDGPDGVGRRASTGELVAATTVMRARATERGQSVLVGRVLTTVDDGVQRTRVLVDPAEFRAATDRILGVPAGDR
ncbi:arylamine N-acetyltransferase family protein [Thermomonospora umbrina]|uniref:Amide synthase n=1 Tax=Thermomonospora umbrina TaxID=111806 RepID=A0A3D9SPC5_9ACTN|nr:arylamine N-acetyltransferase [Thermomonospora umbrina]REE94795.1 amide synthase [Thermomonospora umbrina]